MTRPAHTVKHIHSSFNNYQKITLVCALLTITACMLAVVSGLRVHALIEQFEKTAANALTIPDPAVAQELERTQQFLRGIQEQLKAERQRSEKLKERVVDLERSKAGSKIELPAISPTRLPNSVKVGNTAAPVAQSDRPVAAQPQQAPLWQPFTALPTTSSAPEKEDLTPVTSSNIGSYRKAYGLRHPGAVSQPPVAAPAENATAPPILVPAVLSDEN